MVCKNAGSSNPDISGIGIIVAFATQAGLSIFVSICAFGIALRENIDWFYRRYDRQGELDMPQKKLRKKMQELAQNILMAISNMQIINGLALLITGIQQHRDISLYHQRIIFDVVNLTGISFCASLLALWISEPERKGAMKRHWLATIPIIIVSKKFLIILFCSLYITFTALFLKALMKWDDEIPGHCYLHKAVATPKSVHPQVDIVYVGFTSLFTIGVVAACWMLGKPTTRILRKLSKKDSIHLNDLFHENFRLTSLFWFAVNQGFFYTAWTLRVLTVFTGLFFQYPLHLYMIRTLRVANQDLLENTEGSWGFGQVIVLVLLLALLQQIISAFKEYQDEKASEEDKV